MPYQVKFDNGKTVSFDKQPSPQDIDYIAQKVGITPTPQISPEERKKNIATNLLKTTAQADKYAKEANFANSRLGFGLNFGKEVVKNVAPSEVAFGKQVGGSIASKVYGGEMEKISKDYLKAGESLVKIASTTQDPEKKKQLIMQAQEYFREAGNVYNEVLGEEYMNTTTGQVLGAAGGTALDVATGGTYGRMAAGANTGRLLTGTPMVAQGAKAMGIGVDMAKNTAPSAMNLLTGQTFKQAAQKTAGGAAIGYGFDVGQNLQEGKTGVSALTPGFGTLIGAATPALLYTGGKLEGKIRGVPVDEAVKKGMDKGVRPTVVGKRSEGQKVSYYNKATEAVKTIHNYKDNLKFIDADGNEVHGKLPRTLDQFGQAISQIKKTIFQEYDAMAKASGRGGNMVDFNNIAKILKEEANNEVLKLKDPKVAKYALEMSNRLKKMGKMTPEKAQELIASFNNDLKGLKTYGTGSKAAIDIITVNHLRKALDDMITNETGEGYQRLKKMYGALSAIESEVNHRSIVDARKNNRGVIDIANLFHVKDVVQGMASGDLPTTGRGLVAWAGSKMYKYMNSPNRAIKNMFQQVEKGMKKGNLTRTGIRKIVQSETKPKGNIIERAFPQKETRSVLKKVKNIPAGMSIKASPEKINLINRLNEIKTKVRGLSPDDVKTKMQLNDEFKAVQRQLKEMSQQPTKSQPQFNPLIQEGGKPILTNIKKLSKKDILSKQNIQPKKDIVITDIHGVKHELKKGVPLTAREMMGGKVVLTNGRDYVVPKSQYQNLRNNSAVDEKAKKFLPELKKTQVIVKSGDEIDPQMNAWQLAGGLNKRNVLFQQKPLEEGRRKRVMKGGTNVRYHLDKIKNPKQDISIPIGSKSFSGNGWKLRGDDFMTRLPKRTWRFVKSFERNNGIKFKRAYVLPQEGNNPNWLAEGVIRTRYGKVPIQLVKVNKKNKFASYSLYIGGIPADWSNFDKERLTINYFHRKVRGGKFVSVKVRPSDFTRNQHFSEPNIWSHALTNDRSYKKQPVLHADEFQSDWKTYMLEMKDRFADELFNTRRFNLLSDDKKEKVLREIDRREIGKPPFKNWLRPLLKSLVKMAVAEKKKYFTWSNGAQIRNKYELSNHAKKLSWEDMYGGEKKNVRLDTIRQGVVNLIVNDRGVVTKTDGSGWIGRVEGKNLSEILPVDLYEKVMGSKEGMIRGKDLDVGMQWPFNLYDRQAKNELESVFGQKIKYLDLGIKYKNPGDGQYYLAKPGEIINEQDDALEAILDKMKPLNKNNVKPGTLFVYDDAGEASYWYIVSGMKGGYFRTVKKGYVDGELALTKKYEKFATQQEKINAAIDFIKSHDSWKTYVQSLPVVLKKYPQPALEITPRVEAIARGEGIKIKKPSGRWPSVISKKGSAQMKMLMATALAAGGYPLIIKLLEKLDEKTRYSVKRDENPFLDDMETIPEASAKELEKPEEIKEEPKKELTPDDFDLKKYATDPNHTKRIKEIFDGLGKVETAEDVEKDINRISSIQKKESPLTGKGQFILDMAKKYDIPVKMLMAAMRQDSTYGINSLTKNNPGNIGNNDSGQKIDFETIEDGIEAVAKFLKKIKISD